MPFSVPKSIRSWVNQVALFRLVGLSSGPFIVFFRFLLPEDAFDPMWQRLVIAGLFIGLSVASFFVDWIKKNVLTVASGVIVIMTVWMLQLVFYNDFRLEYLLIYFAALFTALVLFDTVLPLVVFVVLNWLGGGFMILFGDTGTINPLFFLGTQWYLLGITGITVGYRIVQKKKLMNKDKKNSAVIQAAFEASGLGILITTIENKVIDYNDEFLKMWTLTPEYMKDSENNRLIEYCQSQLKNQKEVATDIVKFLRSKEMQFTSYLTFKDGRSMERYVTRLFSEEKELGRVWFYRDVTQRKQYEEELIQRNYELDSFVYRASHDLKAPLNSIMGLLSLLNQNQNDPDTQEYLNLMDRSVNKLDTFIKNLTDFSRITRLELNYGEINFAQYIEDALASLEFMEGANEVRTIIEIDNQAPFFADAFHLGIILNNLVSNAFKYRDPVKEDPQVQIKCEVKEKEAVITIRDNGMGIPEQHQGKIFELFFRATHKAFGSGLGLYICQNAVRKMKGKINLQSKEGEGTTFTVTLPNNAPSN